MDSSKNGSKAGAMPRFTVTVHAGDGADASSFTTNIFAHNQSAAIAIALFASKLIDLDKPNVLPLPVDEPLRVECRLWQTPN